MSREQGFYWVKYYNEWTIAWYDVYKFWTLFNGDIIDSEKSFQEIDERKIVR